jgi:flagellar motor switch/type III secretory pathway protein FliN
MSLSLEDGEADYFSALLAMQSATQQSSAVPEPVLELVQSVKAAVQKEGIPYSWPKPSALSAPELAGYGTMANLTVFQRQIESAQTVIALHQNAVIGLANLLFGVKPVPHQRMPSRVETQIVNGFVELLDADFKPVDAPQTTIIWQDYTAAKLPFSTEAGSAYLLLMINRRSENLPTHQAPTPDIEQQNYMRQAVGSSLLDVDYVLDGGKVSLAMLRNLEPGSTLPLASLSEASLEARANGKAVFSGDLKLTANQMAIRVKRILTEGRND